MVRRASVILFLVVALLSFGGLLAFAADEKPAEEAKPYAIGDKIKPVPLINLDGKEVMVSTGGNLTAISFFSSSCSACRAELAFLDRLAKAEPKLSIMAVSVDFKLALVKAFADETKLKMDFYQDKDYSFPQSFGFTSSPAMVLVNKEGKVVYKKNGFVQRDGPEIMKAVKDNL